MYLSKYHQLSPCRREAAPQKDLLFTNSAVSNTDLLNRPLVELVVWHFLSGGLMFIQSHS